MKIYVNRNGEIKDVISTSNPNLKEIEVTDGTFDGMSADKICCYKVEVENGQIRMMTLYVSDKVVDALDRLSINHEQTVADVAYIAMESVVEL